MLEYIILGFLMCGDCSGYELKQWMKQSTSYFFDASFGSIYPALKRLEQKEMVTCQEIVEGNKFKKVYQIKDSGREAFMNWIEQPIIFEKSKQDHLVKIFFYQFLTKDKAIKLLKAFVKEVEPVLKQLSQQKDEVEEQYDISLYYYRYSTMEYGVSYYRFVLDWCNNLIKKLEDN